MEALPREDGRPFHVVTPVLESIALSKVAGTKVWMKMENAQPTGSFKIRGISYFCQQVDGIPWPSRIVSLVSVPDLVAAGLRPALG